METIARTIVFFFQTGFGIHVLPFFLSRGDERASSDRKTPVRLSRRAGFLGLVKASTGERVTLPLSKARVSNCLSNHTPPRTRLLSKQRESAEPTESATVFGQNSKARLVPIFPRCARTPSLSRVPYDRLRIRERSESVWSTVWSIGARPRSRSWWLQVGIL